MKTISNMENTKTPMKDKETEDVVKTFVNKVWKDNDDNLSYSIGENGVISSIEKLEFTKKELMKFSKILAEEVEHEAEIRGYERGAEQLRKDITNRVVVGLVGDDDKLYKLNLVEVENK